MGIHGELAKTDGRGQAVVSVEDVVVRAQAVQLDGRQQPTTLHGLQDSLEALVVVVSTSALGRSKVTAHLMRASDAAHDARHVDRLGPLQPLLQRTGLRAAALLKL